MMDLKMDLKKKSTASPVLLNSIKFKSEYVSLNCFDKNKLSSSWMYKVRYKNFKWFISNRDFI